jgi:hypothetical protein
VASLPGGAVAGVVSRERATGAAAAGGASPFASIELRDEESDDLELWVLQAGGESLLAAHLPQPTCLRAGIGHPVLWCHIGWTSDRALLKIDPVAGHVGRIDGALTPQAHAALLGPSTLAVLTRDSRLGVVDLATRRGAWLTLPPDRAPDQSHRFLIVLAEGGLGVVTETPDKEATLTTYAMP